MLIFTSFRVFLLSEVLEVSKFLLSVFFPIISYLLVYDFAVRVNNRKGLTSYSLLHLLKSYFQSFRGQNQDCKKISQFVLYQFIVPSLFHLNLIFQFHPPTTIIYFFNRFVFLPIIIEGCLSSGHHRRLPPYHLD